MSKVKEKAAQAPQILRVMVAKTSVSVLLIAVALLTLRLLTPDIFSVEMSS